MTFIVAGGIVGLAVGGAVGVVVGYRAGVRITWSLVTHKLR